MKNYNQSDYAINKKTRNIVYRFADGTVEITLEEYLAQNPGKTKKHFGRLKAISNAIYREQDRADNAQTKKNLSIHALGDARDCDEPPPDEQYIKIQDIRCAAKAIQDLLEGDLLTETQRRRFVLYVFKGITTRKIAKQEGVSQRAVIKSIHAATKVIKKYF